MKNKIVQFKKTLLVSLGFSLLFGASASHAQIPALPVGALGGGGIPVLGALSLDGLPVLGDLLGGGASLPGLGGGLLALDSFANLNSDALSHMLSPETLTKDPTAYLTALEGLMAIASSPQTFVPVPLAPPLVFGFVPGFEVLYTAPQDLLGYVLGGGSIFDSSLVALPAIPLVSAPLPLGLAELGGLEALPLDGFGAITTPEQALSGVLLLIP